MTPNPPVLVLCVAALAALAPCAPSRAGDSAHPRSADAPQAATATAARRAASVPAAPADAEAHPIERLRERLSERLRAPSANHGGTLELQVSTRTPIAPAKAVATGVHPVAHPPPATSPSAGSRKPKAAAAGGGHAAASGHGSAHAAPHWGYEGAAGPAAWGGLKPEFGLCANGQRQSPIDIRGGLPVGLEPVKFDYQDSRFTVVDNGHTVQVNLQGSNAIEIGTRRFDLVQFHFHRPSEERIDGRQFEMSLHLVHKDSQGRLAVVGVLLDRGPAHPTVQQVWNNLPLERGEELPARATINPADLLPADRRYYTYMGSLTTPPCSEGVLWVVMRTPLSVTAEQVGIFSRIYPMNARPVQSASGRRILQSD